MKYLIAFFLFSTFVLSAKNKLNALESKTEQIIKKYNFVTGDVDLGNNMAILHLPKGYKFLKPNDARLFISNIWKIKPTKHKVLGIIFPNGNKPINKNSVAIEIVLEKFGHFTDEQAYGIDMPGALKIIQKNYKPDIVSWKDSITYDVNKKIVYWTTKHIDTVDNRTYLIYRLSLLGNESCIVFNVFHSEKDSTYIKNISEDIENLLELKPGYRFKDYGVTYLKILCDSGYFGSVYKQIEYIDEEIFSTITSILKKH